MVRAGSDPRPGGPAAVGFVFGVLQAEAVPGPVLVRLIADTGMAEPATRTMLSRMVRGGRLSTTRHGRVAVYQLAGGFRDQFFRVRHADERPSWTGSFHTILYDIPETRRADRDGLRDRAAEAGFGSVRPGLLIGLADPAGWITPWSERSGILVEAATLGCSIPTARRLAERAWSLAELATALERFVDQLQAIGDQYHDGPPNGRDAFMILNTTMRSYAGLYLRMPTVPDELTPPGWPGRRIPTALGRVSDLLGPVAADHARSAVSDLELDHLVEPIHDRQ
ncbi:MAG: hypothetical protein J2P23_07825 [Microlunatus sp.]|nr:hypothetical protein [Microlunatus sp.]